MKDKLIEIKNRVSEDKLKDFEGPLPLRASTSEFQRVVWKILDSHSDIRFFHDQKGELNAIWSEKATKCEVNITQALQKGVDFNHIILSKKDYETYYQFIKWQSRLAVKACKDEKYLSCQRKKPEHTFKQTTFSRENSY